MNIAKGKKGLYPVSLILAAAATLMAPLFGLDMVWGTGYHDTQRWIEIVIFACVGVIFLLRIAKGVFFLPGLGEKFVFWALGFVLLGLISAGASDFPMQALFEIGIFIFMFLLAWMIAAEVAGDEVLLEWVLAGVVVGCALYGVKSLMVYSAALFMGGQPDPGNLITGFDSYRFFNHGQTVTLPLIGLFVCLRHGFKFGSRRWLILGWATLAVWWMLLYLSAGRGTFIGILVAFGCVGFLMRERAWPWTRTMIIGAMMGLVGYILLYIVVPYAMGLEPFGYMGKVVQRSVHNFASSRDLLWGCAVRMIGEDPWLGAGPLHYAHKCAAMGLAAHPHNWALQLASEWGIPAFICACFIFFLAFIRLYKNRFLINLGNIREFSILTCWLATLCAIFVDGLVSGLIVMPISQLWLAIFFGLVWGWGAGGVINKKELLISQIPRLAAAGVVVFAASLLIVGVIETRRSAESAARADGIPFNILRPRAWGHGFLI